MAFATRRQSGNRARVFTGSPGWPTTLSDASPARAVLAKLNINCSLKDIWMVLATEEAVRAAAVAQSCCAATGNHHHHQETSHGAANESSSTPREDGEAKVILLGRQARGAGKLSFEVMR